MITGDEASEIAATAAKPFTGPWPIRRLLWTHAVDTVELSAKLIVRADSNS
jgi:hypothetical protein